MTPQRTDEPPVAAQAQEADLETSAEVPGEAAPLPGSVLGRQAWAAFQRDYPQLVQERCGQWVAYHGDRQIGFAPTRGELYQECLRQGCRPDEFVVCSIEPVVEEMALGYGGIEGPLG
jgi:hypothetical protein